MRNKKILVDSDVLIWFLRDKYEVVNSLTEMLPVNHLFISPISVAEIYAGARKKELKTIDEFISLFEVFDVNKDLAITAGQYLSKFSKSHSVEIADAIIGATAAKLDLLLWTFNIKHYPMLKKKQFFDI